MVRSCMDWKVPEDWVHESGRMVILGEAAHPFIVSTLRKVWLFANIWPHSFQPGQTQPIAMGVEDGAVLAKVFSHLKRKDQISSFLWAFQDLRRDRVTALMQGDKANLWYMAQPASEQTRMRNQLFREKHAAGINVLDNADEHTEVLWAEMLRIFGYDAEDEADNWWVEWGLLRERASGKTAFDTLDYDLIVQVDLEDDQ
jgi:salicylate hydroxylase